MKTKIINKFTLADRLEEVVDAMRNVEGMTSAEWEKHFPTVAKAVKSGPFSNSPATANVWDREVSALKTELAIRTAEFLLAWKVVQS